MCALVSIPTTAGQAGAAAMRPRRVRVFLPRKDKVHYMTNQKSYQLIIFNRIDVMELFYVYQLRVSLHVLFGVWLVNS
jgi:hypothetical protein